MKVIKEAQNTGQDVPIDKPVCASCGNQNADRYYVADFQDSVAVTEANEVPSKRGRYYYLFPLLGYIPAEDPTYTTFD